MSEGTITKRALVNLQKDEEIYDGIHRSLDKLSVEELLSCYISCFPVQWRRALCKKYAEKDETGSFYYVNKKREKVILPPYTDIVINTYFGKESLAHHAITNMDKDDEYQKFLSEILSDSGFEFEESPEENQDGRSGGRKEALRKRVKRYLVAGSFDNKDCRYKYVVPTREKLCESAVYLKLGEDSTNELLGKGIEERLLDPLDLKDFLTILVLRTQQCSYSLYRDLIEKVEPFVNCHSYSVFLMKNGMHSLSGYPESPSEFRDEVTEMEERFRSIHYKSIRLLTDKINNCSSSNTSEYSQKVIEMVVDEISHLCFIDSVTRHNALAAAFVHYHGSSRKKVTLGNKYLIEEYEEAVFESTEQSCQLVNGLSYHHRPLSIEKLSRKDIIHVLMLETDEPIYVEQLSKIPRAQERGDLYSDELVNPVLKMFGYEPLYAGNGYDVLCRLCVTSNRPAGEEYKRFFKNKVYKLTKGGSDD